MSRRPAERRRMCSIGAIKYSSCDISTVQARLNQGTEKMWSTHTAFLAQWSKVEYVAWGHKVSISLAAFEYRTTGHHRSDRDDHSVAILILSRRYVILEHSTM